MPRWRPLPEELDPQVQEFASQLRRLVDRSGLSVAAIADRTGYSKSSWERYLNGRLLPPRGATQALAEVTGTDVRHLGTMWELAERAWSRAEMRHDVTMEAARIAQARAALGEFGDDPGKGRKRGRLRDRARRLRGADDPHGVQGNPAPEGAALESARPMGESAAPPAPSPQEAAESAELDDQTAVLRPEVQREQAREAQREKQRKARETIQRAAREEAQHRAEQRQGESGSTRDRAPGSRPPGRDAPGKRPSPWAGTGSGSGPGSGGPQRVDLTSWGSGGRDAATGSKASGTPAGRTRTGSTGPVGGALNGGVPGAGSGGGAGAGGGSGASGAPGGPGQDAGKRRVTMFLAGIVGTLVLVAAAVLLFDLMGAGADEDKPKTAPTVSDPKLPAGVKCQGADCAGKDPEKAGCGGQHARTSSSSYVGRSYVEVRYSKICQAAWARVTGAGQGDTLRVNVGKRAASDTVDATSDAYTEMVAATSSDAARACLTYSAGGRGCTTPGTTSPSPSEGR